MDRNWQNGTWLLMDAAGPETIFGLLKEGAWLEYMISENAFLEECQSSVDYLVSDNDLSLEELSGVIYASGPGSTLGLRLAAMFIRSLLEVPRLQHWKCAQYNNLELAAASLIEDGEGFPIQAVAPWRRDKVHRVTITRESPLELHLDSLHPDELDLEKATLFALGNRPRNLPEIRKTRDIHVIGIPNLLVRYPGLLLDCPEPVPFTAESPEFARWSSKRHASR